MKVIKLESMPDLDAVVKAIEESEEPEPITLQRNGGQVAVIVSSADYANFLALEEALGDQLDREESEEILKDPKWIDWDQARKQFKS